jgi:hypothetical protein
LKNDWLIDDVATSEVADRHDQWSATVAVAEIELDGIRPSTAVPSFGVCPEPSPIEPTDMPEATRHSDHDPYLAKKGGQPWQTKQPQPSALEKTASSIWQTSKDTSQIKARILSKNTLNTAHIVNILGRILQKKSRAQARAGRSVTVSGALWHSSARSAMRASGSWQRTAETDRDPAGSNLPFVDRTKVNPTVCFQGQTGFLCHSHFLTASVGLSYGLNLSRLRRRAGHLCAGLPLAPGL